LLEFGLRRADVVREVIVFETCVQQPKQGPGLKCALSLVGQSAPIRDR
jgi:hypothetical protein